MRLVLLAIVLIGVIMLTGYLLNQSRPLSTGSPPPATEEDLLLPDLKLSPPGQLYITTSEGIRKIRFSTTFINQGNGPIEVMGRTDLEKNKTGATQRISKKDGSLVDREIGEFVFHPGHEHWHIENYALFELWNLKGNGERDRLLATTNKMSFCLWDENPYDLSLENASQVQKYVNCNNEIQGVSVGWSDTYDASVEGQELDITSIDDGSYLIRSLINPDRKIMESDYDNNEVFLRIRISGNVLTIEGSP